MAFPIPVFPAPCTIARSPNDIHLLSSKQHFHGLHEHVRNTACATITSPAYFVASPPISLPTWIALKFSDRGKDADGLELWGELEIYSAVTAEVVASSPGVLATSTMVRSPDLFRVPAADVSSRQSRRQRLKIIHATLRSDEVLRSLSRKLAVCDLGQNYFDAVRTPEHQLKIICGAFSTAHGFNVFAAWFRPLVHPLIAVVNAEILMLYVV